MAAMETKIIFVTLLSSTFIKINGQYIKQIRNNHLSNRLQFDHVPLSARYQTIYNLPMVPLPYEKKFNSLILYGDKHFATVYPTQSIFYNKLLTKQHSFGGHILGTTKGKQNYTSPLTEHCSASHREELINVGGKDILMTTFGRAITGLMKTLLVFPCPLLSVLKNMSLVFFKNRPSPVLNSFDDDNSSDLMSGLLTIINTIISCIVLHLKSWSPSIQNVNQARFDLLRPLQFIGYNVRPTDKNKFSYLLLNATKT